MPGSECLEDLLERERTLPVQQAISIAYQLAEFFTVAHARGLVHGAVFPSAIVVESWGKASVDFDGPRCGPRPPDAKPADDVSGLGGVMYRMLCGQPPSDLLPVSVLRPETPGEISALVTSMLASEPLARPMMADVVRQLAPFYKPGIADDDSNAQLEQYKQTQQWDKAIETIMQRLDVETDPLRRASLSRDAAQISRDQLDNTDSALEYLDYALDAYFMEPDSLNDTALSAALDAFRSLEGILNENSRWRDLERAYRKMIARTKNTGPRFNKVRAALFAKIGELYRDRLDMAESAEAAFEEARRLDSGAGGSAYVSPGSLPVATVEPIPVPDAQSDAPSWNDDARMNDPIGLGLGPPVAATSPAKPRS